MASRCNCPVYLLSVTPDEEGQADAEDAIARATQAIKEAGVDVVEATIRHGDPVETIIRQGKNFSVIVMAEPHVKGMRRWFTKSVSQDVLRDAYNSVMIVR